MKNGADSRVYYDPLLNYFYPGPGKTLAAGLRISIPNSLFFDYK